MNGRLNPGLCTLHHIFRLMLLNAAQEPKQEDACMTETIARNFPKALAALAIAASFLSGASLAGEFTVEQGKRYRATLSLKSVEQLADNELIARKFRALGFTRVRVSGAGATRRVEGIWPGKDSSAPLPPQIVAVARM
jgi:hypothetical protein